ncbi:putative triosephosphate isomerase [Magnetofaba australis IT-1]|uniref:Triosephosphate isomerase n=2 Tax=Magnetofaba TaxID=1472292 RepID=A0A1Y2K613_9PROT|nr:putative triosephosphate isomerase [Magnetofaba australis IT-1]
MNGLLETAQELAGAIQTGLTEREEKRVVCEVLICPPFTALSALHQQLGESSLKLGAQDMAVESSGAYTGEVSGLMLRNVGCRYVILGHSERRSYYGETDEVVAAKTASAYRDGLTPIVCVGETLEEREAGKTLEVIDRQVNAMLPSLPETDSKRQTLVIAYEPVWAIGTGKVATTEQAQEVHAHIRAQLAKALGDATAGKIRILYGGSMKPGNAKELLAQTDIDGGLIGGAALNANDFLAIVDSLPN